MMEFASAERTSMPFCIIRITKGTMKKDVDEAVASNSDILFFHERLISLTFFCMKSISLWNFSKDSRLWAKVLTTGIPRTYSTISDDIAAIEL